MKKEAFTRQVFHELIWKTTRTKILEKYVLSDSHFRKICDNMNIKYPKGGYWSKLKHNKPVKIDKLSDDFKGEDKIELILREEGMTSNDQSPLAMLTDQICNDKAAPLKVPCKLNNPDILIKNTQDYFDFRKKGGWHSKFNKTILPIRYEIIDKNRALRLIDTLVKLLKYRGHSITLNYNNDPRINIKGIEIEFYLREKTKRVPSKNGWSTTDKVPTGEFAIKFGRYSREKEFSDGKLKLEDCLAQILAFLELYAENEIIRNEEIRVYHLKREEEEKIRKAHEEKKKNELAKFNKLISNSNRFEQTEKIRNYINAVEKIAIANNNLDEELKNWIIWAKEKTEWYDPLINKYDELLNNVEK